MGARGRRPDIDGRRARVLRLLAAAVVLLLLLAIFIPLAGRNQSQLSAYSAHWNDLSQLRDLAKSLGLSSRSLLSGARALSDADPRSSVLVIIGVEKAYTAEEEGAIAAFARAGGNIIVADDFGHGGELLDGLTDRRIGLRTDCLRDLRFQKNPDFVNVKVRLSNSLNFPSVDLMLNRPSALRIEPAFLQQRPTGLFIRYNPEVVANTSVHSWLDTNRNLERDPDEPESPYAVAAFYRLDSDARVLAVSDPGIFVNDMIGRACNRQFVLSVLMSLGQHRSTVIFDESRHAPEGPAAGAGSSALQTATAFAQNPGAILLSFLLCFLLSLFQYTRLPPPDVRRHRDILGEPRLLHFRTPAVSANEFQRLRVAIVEKVRLAYGLTPEEFYPAMLPRLPRMLADPELQRFLDYETWPDLCSFGGALIRAGSWAPPPAPGMYRPEMAPREPVEYSEVELVDEPAKEPIDMERALFGESGGVKIWDPSNRRRDGTDIDSMLYGTGRAGDGEKAHRAAGGGGE
jgi:hypothetical protein